MLSEPENSDEPPLFNTLNNNNNDNNDDNDDAVFDSPETLFQKSLPHQRTDKKVEANNPTLPTSKVIFYSWIGSSSRCSQKPPAQTWEYEWLTPHLDVLERAILFFNFEAGQPLDTKVCNAYLTLSLVAQSSPLLGSYWVWWLVQCLCQGWQMLYQVTSCKQN